MIRWIVIALFIYLMLRLMSGPKRTTGRSSRFKVEFGPRKQPPRPSSKRPTIDQIEEAEYEDITESEPSEKKES